MALDKGTFRRVMGQFATGVTIATTRGQAGIAGLTVNSFTSVSLDPLLVLICIDLHSQALPSIRESGVFAINILSQEQEELSNRFAFGSLEERYSHFLKTKHYIAATGAPILASTLAFIDARVTAEYPGGDHAIFVGQVEAAGYDGQVFFTPGISDEQSTFPVQTSAIDLLSSNGHNQPATPLLYYQGKYHHLANQHQHEHSTLAPVKHSHE